MTAPENRPPQMPPQQSDLMASIQKKLAEQQFGGGLRAPTPRQAALLAQRDQAPASAPPEADSLLRSNTETGDQPNNSKSSKRSRSATESTSTTVGGNTFNHNISLGGSKTGRWIAGVLLAGIVVAGAIEHKNVAKWYEAATNHTTSHRVNPAIPGQNANKTTTGASAAVVTPTSTAPAALAGPLPEFKPKSIPPTEMIRGTVTDLEIPVQENYTKPGDKTKTVFRLNRVFAVKVDGTFTITVSAPVGPNANNNALTYNSAESLGLGKSVSVADLDGKKMITTLDLSKLTAVPLAPSNANNVTALAATFSANVAPAHGFTPTEAATLFKQVVGDPAGTTMAAKQGQTADFYKDANNAVVSLLEANNAAKIASIYGSYLGQIIQGQQTDQKIPKGNTNDHINLAQIPDMRAQYPPATNPAFTMMVAQAILKPGTAAKDHNKAVSPTIDVESAK